MMISQLLVDYTRCTGCRLCELACSAHHEKTFQPTHARLRIIRYDDLGIDIPSVCGPCEEAPCVEVCPVYAMRRDPVTKMTYLDPEKCILCKSCVGACVNGVIVLDTQNMRVLKCDHCGGTPECAKICPTGAIDYGPASHTGRLKRHDRVRRYLKEVERLAAEKISRGESRP